MRTPLPASTVTSLIASAVVALWISMPAAAQPDQPRVDPEREVPTERALEAIDRAIEQGEERLKRARSLRERLASGERVGRDELRALLERRGDDRPPARGDGRGDFFDRQRPGEDGRRGDDERSPWRGAYDDLDDEQKERVIAFLREHAPEGYRRVTEAGGAMGERVLKRMLAPRAMQVIEAQERDAAFGSLKLDEFKSGVALFDAGRRLREAFVRFGLESDEFVAARSDFREAVAGEVRSKLRLRQSELEQIERRVARQREELSQEQEQIDERVDQSVADVIARLQRGESERPRGRRGGEPQGGPGRGPR